MAKEDYDRGVRDGKKNSVSGDPSKSLAREVTEGYSKKEREALKDYKQGRDHGRSKR